jgi:citrate lyase subunit beta/citryl-CoA lyase
MSESLPVWRSLLFIPAHVDKFIAKAHERGADACILDLEDSVPLAQKEQARAAVIAAAQAITAKGPAVLVRVNNPWPLTAVDIEAVVCAAVRAIVLPKVEDAVTVQAAAQLLDRLEAERGLAPGHTWLIAQIEDIAALPQLDRIAAASPRLLGMSLGSEDFSVSAGMEPVQETLLWPNQQVVFACRRAGILPFGFPGSIADFSDAPHFRQTIVLARQLGMVGAFCIHPDQVGVLNEVLSPSAEEVEHARGLLAAQAEAEREGRGAFAYRGKMVDPPVVARAREVLRRHAATRRQGASPDIQ